MADNPQFSAPVTASTPDTIVYTTRYETNTSTGAIKLVTEALNVTTGSVSYLDPDSGAAYVPTGTIANEPIRIQTLKLTPNTTGSNLAPTVLAFGPNDNHAEIHVFDPDGIVYTLDGTPPAGTSGAGFTTGFRVNAGATFELESRDEISNFNGRSLNSDPNTNLTDGLYVEYFNFGDSWSGLTD